MATRMAGEALAENPEVNEEVEKQNKTKVDLNTDNNPYTNKKITDFDLTSTGAGSKKGTERLSKSDIKNLYQQGKFSKQEIVDFAENYKGDGPGASGAKAQKILNRYKQEIAGNTPEEPTNEDNTTEPTPPNPEQPTTQPTPEPEQKKTLAEFVGEPTGDYSTDFVNRFVGLNRFNAQNRTNENYAQRAIDNAKKNKGVNIAALDKNINQRPMYREAKGDLQFLNTFGDIYKFKPKKWRNAEPGEPVKSPDFKGIYDDIKDDIDDI